jgi:glycosyltransferase involved in cell wall biosynthesis
MQGILRSANASRGALTVEAVDAVRALEAAGHDPVVLAYHPIARWNPVLELLYGEAWDLGIAAIPMAEEARIEELADFAALGFRTVLHLHWLNLPLAKATSTDEAERAVDAFLGRLDRFLAAGGHIAWTVHNVLSHGSRFEAAESRMLAAVAQRSTVIHVMAASTRERVAPWYDLPADRLLHVPHPSYVGAYEDHLSRPQARHELGLMPDELVYQATGAIRAYKGLTDLLDAWDSLPSRPPRRLLIAGPVGRDVGTPELVERAVLHPRVLIHDRHIPSGQMQLFLRAADLAVLPYVQSLNSGALMLALTFGLPVIVPAGGGLAELVDDRFAVTYPPDVPGGLAEALVRAADLATPAAREAALEVARAHDPVTLSRRFAEGLRRMLGA